jgi:benzoate transport
MTAPAPDTVAQPMTAFQVGAVLICLVLNLIDGFDVLAIAFAAPSLAQDWKLEPAALGALLSAGLAGMTAGSLCVAPLADRWGRRALILISLALVSVGMLGAGATQTTGQLGAARIVTGLGVGAMLPSLNTIVAEYSSARRRALALSLMATGYPIGATIGGIAAIFIAERFGWRGIFVFGGLLSVVMIPLAMWRLPEPHDFLRTKGPAGALVSAKPRDLVAGGLTARTGLLWLAFFCVMFVFYFVMSWTPKLLVDAGLSADKGVSGGVLVNLGGIAGVILLGVLAGRLGIFKLHVMALVAAAASIFGFGLMSGSLVAALALAAVVGFFLFTSMVGLYVITASIYPTEIRNTGTGLAIGVGRLGGVVSPYLAGVLLSAGWRPAQAYMAFGLPLLLAAIAVAALARQVTAASRV